MHEIITLQLGHQANYLGTHFWNTQVITDLLLGLGIDQLTSFLNRNRILRTPKMLHQARLTTMFIFALGLGSEE